MSARHRSRAIAAIIAATALSVSVAGPVWAALGVVATIVLPGSAGPSGLAVSPDGTKVYVAHTGTDTVEVIDAATGTLAATPIALPGSASPGSVAFSPDGTKAYVANSFSHTVSVIDVATDTVTSTIVLPVGSGPYAVRFSPDRIRA